MDKYRVFFTSTHNLFRRRMSNVKGLTCCLSSEIFRSKRFSKRKTLREGVSKTFLENNLTYRSWWSSKSRNRVARYSGTVKGRIPQDREDPKSCLTSRWNNLGTHTSLLTSLFRTEDGEDVKFLTNGWR